MSDQGAASEAAKAIGDPLATFVGWLAGLLPEGPARTLLYVVVGLCVAGAPFIYKYYLGLLAQGAAPDGSLERQDYDTLRAGLEGGNLAARLYAKWLTAFLDGVERFFGDVGMADRTLFPRAFGLRKPAPLWTAPAFDRCLLLALIYPIATIFVIWAVSGDVGPAEASLRLPPDLPGWKRSLTAGAIGLQDVAIWCVGRTEGRKSFFWRTVAVASVGAVAATGAGAVVLAFSVTFAFAGAFPFFYSDVPTVNKTVLFAGFIAAVIASGFAFGGNGPPVVLNFAGAVYYAFAGAGAATVGFAVASAFLTYSSGAGSDAGIGPAAFASAVFFTTWWLTFRGIKYRRQNVFLSLFLPTMVLACLAGAAFLSSTKTWNLIGPLLLFLGLLTLLNAPFDWASLGVTRALLRRGLERGDWWPYAYAILDALLATGIILLLALTMVIGVQAFDELAVHGGGKDAAVLPLDALFDGIAKNPGAPEFWWAYALLLSTMIPSLINLAIAGTALTRGIPGLPRLLLLWTPEGRDVPEYKRPFVAAGLTLQVFAGAGLGFAAQGFLALVIIHYAIPSLGLDLLGWARAVAGFDFPARVGQLFVALR